MHLAISTLQTSYLGSEPQGRLLFLDVGNSLEVACKLGACSSLPMTLGAAEAPGLDLLRGLGLGRLWTTPAGLPVCRLSSGSRGAAARGLSDVTKLQAGRGGRRTGGRAVRPRGRGVSVFI